jgi:A/G-specific adenine glycosylase
LRVYQFRHFRTRCWNIGSAAFHVKSLAVSHGCSHGCGYYRRVNGGDRLLEWFGLKGRDLPWRTEPRSPYQVLVSELMLQQTQVTRVVERFADFVVRFPSIDALAAASEDEVLAAWSGLGYYRRARLLHRLARELAGRGGGFPTEAAELTALPGIGDYTAAAVASLAFDRAEPVLDGNTLRVGARVLGLESDPRRSEGRRQIRRWICSLMNGRAPGRVNEALMELGALVCLPRAPSCSQCPLEGECWARAHQAEHRIPRPRPRRASVSCQWVAACCIDEGGRWLLYQVSSGPILRGLWLPPFTVRSPDGDSQAVARRVLPFESVGEGECMAVVRHSITHRRIVVEPVVFRNSRGEPPDPSWKWETPECSGPTSTLLAKLVGSVVL